MASPRGCFKTGCLGCLGLIAIFLLITGITALLAWNDSKTTEPRDEVVEPMNTDEGFLATGHGGSVTLDLAQGEFLIYPAKPGEGLRIEAVYDDELYDLEQEFTTLPDSTWNYELSFLRTTSGMRAFLQSVFAKGPSAKISVYLPPEVPIELVANVAQGGMEGDLGGLWLTSAMLDLRQGGFVLDVSEPLKEPMDYLKLKSSMGGMEVDGLGNASPRKLDVFCKMGGGQVNFDGVWRNDCDANLSISMGGMAVIIPRGLKVERTGSEAGDLVDSSAEVSEPVMKIRTSARYGEIDIVH
jgi:hypothetical protein